jgi:Holliday junction DNA helicase RuvA
MIATLTGVVSEKIGDQLVLEAGGVGYGLYVPVDDYGRLPAGEQAKLYIYEHIREQAHDLYGFSQPAAKQLFGQLLDVNGVGPKMALAILNIGSLDQVKQAIAEGNTKFIQAAQGVGKRVAERVIIDLKDKVGLPSSEQAADFLYAPSVNAQDEATQALVALGFTAQDAAVALKDIDASLPAEERIKQALKSRF